MTPEQLRALIEEVTRASQPSWLMYGVSALVSALMFASRRVCPRISL